MKNSVCSHYLISSSNHLKTNIIACTRDNFIYYLPLELLGIFPFTQLGAVTKACNVESA